MLISAGVIILKTQTSCFIDEKNGTFVDLPCILPLKEHLMNTIIFSYQAMDDDSEAKATDLRVEVTMLRTSMEVHDSIQPTGCVQ